MLTFDQIKELAELVSERGLGRLEVERAGFRVRIDGAPAAGSAPAPAPPAQASVSEAPAAPAAPIAASEEPAAGEAEAEAEDGRTIVTSPIVGTFYRAPSPDGDPFVEVGARVRAGQPLCIVEAMKLMNEIESEVDGVVLEVFPKNGQAVEYGEPLFAIRQG